MAGSYLSDTAQDADLSDLMSEPEVWILRPLFTDQQPTQSGGTSYGEFPGRDWLRRELFLLRPLVGEMALHSDGTLFVWNTVNQRRSLARLPDDPSVESLDVGRGHRGLLDQPRLTARKSRLATKIIHRLRVDDRQTRHQIHRLVGRAMLELRVALTVMRSHRPKQVVVATQHSVPARAAVLAARRFGVPSVYVPHAPVANNRIYRDLPTDIAALRGPREVDHYVSLGADFGRLHVVGNLSLDVRADAPPCPDGPVIVAPSPWEDDRVERFMSVVDQGILGPYLVCPHPRSDVARLRALLPERADLLDEVTTADAIARGCRAVVQHSSGVAVEAMLLGAPVIDVLVDGREATYPAITEPHVVMAWTASDLQGALRSLAEERGRRGNQARKWAEEWVATTGADAEVRLRALLASNLPCHGPILDEWSG